MVGAGSALLTSSLLMYVLANNSSNKTEVVDTPVKIEAEDTSVKIEPKKMIIGNTFHLMMMQLNMRIIIIIIYLKNRIFIILIISTMFLLMK